METEGMVVDLGQIVAILRRRREELGWSLTKVARESGIAREHLSRLEGKKYRDARITTLRRLASALGLTVRFLVDES